MALATRAGQALETRDTCLDMGSRMNHIDAVNDGARDQGGTAALATEESEQEIDRGEQVAHGLHLAMAWRGMAAMANGINRRARSAIARASHMCRNRCMKG